MKVRTRFAPSPTGYLHIGGLRTAAYAYAMTKHNAGEFILRIEDTDQKRLVANSVEKIQEILKTFALDWDEFCVQSERLPLYKNAALKLIESGHAFYCQCDGKTLRDSCRDKNFASGAIRLKIPDHESVSYRDFVFKEEIKWNSDSVFDAVILKSDGFPTYHLAVVVDDHDMNITHVLRGYDWMPSTPLHLLIYKFLDYELPEIGHLTDIQSPEGGKLSKRKGNVSVEQFIADGYLPEAILNFVILLGWAPKDNREMFTLKEFVDTFDPNGFQKSNPVFNTVKLNWFNQQYIRKLSDEDLEVKLKVFTTQKDFKRLIPLVRDRLVTLKDFDSLTDYFFNRPKVEPQNEMVIDHAIKTLETSFDGKVLEEKARAFCAEESLKVGEYFMALRLAITGRSATPPLWDIMLILGKDEILSRLKSVTKPA